MTKELKKGPGRASVEHPELIEPEVVASGGGRSGPRQRIPQQIRRWLDRAKSLGLQTRQLVWELHVIQGHSKSETARLLNVTLPRVWQCYEDAKRELLDRAPKTPEDFEQMREELKDRLLSVYEAACKDESDPRMLAIRLKTLDQLSKLHGLNIEATLAKEGGMSQYATPEELTEMVRARALELHGRGRDIMEARDALTLNAPECGDSGQGV